MYLVLVLLSIFSRPANTFKPCVLRHTDTGSVCVCNATYCDTVPALEPLGTNQYQLITTSKVNLGFFSSVGNFSNSGDRSASDGTVTVSDLSNTHQTIHGFGGAFTDATGINLLKLSSGAQEMLMEAYFGEEGLGYSMGRIPIGGTDFSTRGYTYCDDCRGNLDGFALQPEDVRYKIPLILKAKKLRRDNIKFFASAWTAPAWMKTNNALVGAGKVKDEYFQLWAEYHLKFFNAYKAHNISFWGLTTQNEPIDGLIGADLPNNGFTSSDMTKWIKRALGPAIRNSSYKDLKIMLHDDQRLILSTLKLFVLSDSEVVQYADGIAIHWYSDFIAPPNLLNLASSDEKQLFRLATEACTGYFYSSGLEDPVVLGSWARGEHYLNSITEDLSYDLTGWVDWNMVLDENGGPNYVENQVDSPIIVNGTADEFYKQPMFYVLGHFSKFVVPDSVRVTVEVNADGISSLAFLRPDHKVVVILKNGSSQLKMLKLTILNCSHFLTLEAKSLNTLLYSV